MKTTKEQFAILRKHLPYLKFSDIPEGEGYVIPKWQTISIDSDTAEHGYIAAVKKVLGAIAAARPFYNYRSKEMQGLRETAEKIAAMKDLPNIMLLNAQMGTKYKGRSTKDVRTVLAADGQVGLGAYEVAIILLTHPELLTKYEDLWLDCPGDEFKPSGGSEFSFAPFFIFRGGEVRFGTGWVVNASGYYGSASASLPAVSTLDPGSLGSFESLTLEARVTRIEKVMRDVGLQIGNAVKRLGEA